MNGLSIGSAGIRLALLVVTFGLSACAQEATRPATCHSHKVSNGELTECR
ncbi:hypothetical protein ACQKLX_11015 [Bosea sp. NPDC003192]|jgi:hypothetical protein